MLATPLAFAGRRAENKQAREFELSGEPRSAGRHAWQNRVMAKTARSLSHAAAEPAADGVRRINLAAT